MHHLKKLELLFLEEELNIDMYLTHDEDYFELNLLESAKKKALILFTLVSFERIIFTRKSSFCKSHGKDG